MNCVVGTCIHVICMCVCIVACTIQCSDCIMLCTFIESHSRLTNLSEYILRTCSCKGWRQRTHGGKLVVLMRWCRVPYIINIYLGWKRDREFCSWWEMLPHLSSYIVDKLWAWCKLNKNRCVCGILWPMTSEMGIWPSLTWVSVSTVYGATSPPLRASSPTHSPSPSSPMHTYASHENNEASNSVCKYWSRLFIVLSIRYKLQLQCLLADLFKI